MKTSHAAAAICLVFAALFTVAAPAYSAAVGVAKDTKESKSADKPTETEKKIDEKSTITQDKTNSDKTVKGDKKAGSAEKSDDAIKQVATAEELPPIKMVLVEGGCFEMGDFSGEGMEDESPVHKVCLSSYYISETEVTQEFFAKVTGSNPSFDVDGKSPVTNFTIKMVEVFFFRLNNLTKKKYRLPTEAEWEYAARDRGKNNRWAGTNDEDKLGDYAWFYENSGGKYHNVKKKKPNALGLYDMSGNVYEIVQDNLDLDYYLRSPKVDPLQTRRSMYKIARGGAYTGPVEKNRTTFRYYFEMDLPSPIIGFRLAI